MPTYLMPHGSGWKYLRAIPKDLRALIGKRNATRYLGTLSHSEASIRARSQAVTHDELFSLLRALPQRQKDEIVNAGGLSAWKKQVATDSIPLVFLKAAAHIGRGDLFQEEADDATRARQVLSTLEARSADELAEKSHKPKLELLYALEPTARPKTRHLESLLEAYEREKPSMSQKTKDRTKLYLQRFVEIVGDRRPAEVTRSDVVAFRDALEEQKLSESNINQHLDKIATLFNVAMSAGTVESNPAHKVRARKKTRVLKSNSKGFSEAETRAIFAALPTRPLDHQWITRLCAYHGMRSSEAVQLRVSDVQKMHGVYILRVHDDGDRSVKNAHSIRDVPIHPKCKDIVKLAAEVSAQHGPDALLFQSLKWDDRARQFQNEVGRWIRKELGIKRSHHQFRHRFRTLCREVEMPDSISSAIMGHTLGHGEHGAYGTAPSLARRSKWIAKIDPLKG